VGGGRVELEGPRPAIVGVEGALDGRLDEVLAEDFAASLVDGVVVELVEIGAGFELVDLEVYGAGGAVGAGVEIGAGGREQLDRQRGALGARLSGLARERVGEDERVVEATEAAQVAVKILHWST
jgi:hypothetical protein